MLLIVWQKSMTMYFVRMDTNLQTNFHILAVAAGTTGSFQM